ncbi:MAG: ribosome rescue protein RqcH [Desulfurococcaceae archaeon]
MLKKQMDIIDIYAWTQRYRDSVVDCFIDNVYRAKRYWLLKLRCRDDIKLLKIEPGRRIHFTRAEPMDKDIDNLARYLRAHVRDGKITGMEMPWWERIVVLTTFKHEESLKHYIELLPRGLWVVVDSNDKIMYASRFEEYRDRAIKPGLHYKPPPMRSAALFNENALIDSLNKGKDLVRGIVFEWGLPGYIAEELLHRAGLYEAKNTRPANIPREDLDALLKSYREIVSESLIGKGYLVLKDGSYEIFAPFKPLLFKEIYDCEVKELDDFNDSVDTYFMEYELLMEREEIEQKIQREIESLRLRINEQEAVIRRYEEELNAISNKLRLIYENFESVQRILDCSVLTREKKGWESVISECGVKSFDRAKGVIYVEIGEVIVDLSIRRSLEDQLIELERNRRELEKKIKRAREVLQGMRNQLEKGISREESLSLVKPSPRYWYERFHWMFTRNKYLVIAGRDASQNEAIVKKYLGENDIFIHADIQGAPVVALLTKGSMPEEGDIMDASLIAACYSKAWKAGFSYIDVYWVKGSQVSKKPPSGEYLSKGSFMIYGERNFIKMPLELGIGIRVFCDNIYGEYVKVVVGPRELLDKETLAYAVLMPGDRNPEEIAKDLAEYFERAIRAVKNTPYKIPLRDIVEKLPGKSMIVSLNHGKGPTKCEES